MAKKYYWLKLKDDFFQNPKIKKLRHIAGGDTYTCILLKLYLLSIKSDGVIEHEGIEDDLIKELALIIDEEEKNISVLISYMFAQKMIEEIEKDREYFLKEVPSLIGKEGESAERVRRHRLKKQEVLHCNADVTEMKQIETKCNTEKELDIELELEKKLKIDSLPKKIEKVETKERVFFTNLVHFKKWAVKNLEGYTFFTKDIGWREDTKFEIKQGYIYSHFSKDFLNNADALKVWHYLYSRQNQLLEQAETQSTQAGY